MTRGEQKAATRAKLSAVARAAFHRQGYEAVTFRNLAKAAGVSTGAYFGSWKSKADLFADVMGLPAPDMGEFLARVAIVCAGHPGEVGKVAEEAEAHRRHLVGHHS